MMIWWNSQRVFSVSWSFQMVRWCLSCNRWCNIRCNMGTAERVCCGPFTFSPHPWLRALGGCARIQRQGEEMRHPGASRSRAAAPSLELFGFPIHMPARRLLFEVFHSRVACWRRCGRTRRHRRDNISTLALEHLEVPQEELECVAEQRNIWVTLVSWQTKRQMDGWTSPIQRCIVLYMNRLIKDLELGSCHLHCSSTHSLGSTDWGVLCELAINKTKGHHWKTDGKCGKHTRLFFFRGKKR